MLSEVWELGRNTCQKSGSLMPQWQSINFFLLVYEQHGRLNWRFAWEGFCVTRDFLQQRTYKVWRWNFIYMDSTFYRFLMIERTEFVKAIILTVWTDWFPSLRVITLCHPSMLHEIKQMYWVAILSQNGSLALILPWS